jgi:hypothetical protein
MTEERMIVVPYPTHPGDMTRPWFEYKPYIPPIASLQSFGLRVDFSECRTDIDFEKEVLEWAENELESLSE